MADSRNSSGSNDMFLLYSLQGNIKFPTEFQLIVLQFDTQLYKFDNKRHIFASLNTAIFRRCSVSASEFSVFNEAIIQTLRPTDVFSRYECNGESPSED
jgi:hypothetical protein